MASSGMQYMIYSVYVSIAALFLLELFYTRPATPCMDQCLLLLFLGQLADDNQAMT